MKTLPLLSDWRVRRHSHTEHSGHFHRGIRSTRQVCALERRHSGSRLVGGILRMQNVRVKFDLLRQLQQQQNASHSSDAIAMNDANLSINYCRHINSSRVRRRCVWGQPNHCSATRSARARACVSTVSSDRCAPVRWRTRCASCLWHARCLGGLVAITCFR